MRKTDRRMPLDYIICSIKKIIEDEDAAVLLKIREINMIQVSENGFTGGSAHYRQKSTGLRPPKADSPELIHKGLDEVDPTVNHASDVPVEADANLLISPDLAARCQSSIKSLIQVVCEENSPASELTFKYLVSETIRPLLSVWLNKNLFKMIDTYVSKEIIKQSLAAK